MKTSENVPQDYYDQKQVKRWQSFKTDIKVVILVIMAGIGYWSYNHDCLLTYFIVMIIIGFNYFMFKFMKGVGRRNEAYDKAHKDLDELPKT